MIQDFESAILTDLLFRNFAVGLGANMSGGCTGEGPDDGAFSGAVIPTWSYAKLIKWFITVLTGSGVVVYVADLDRNHIFTNMLIAFILLFILSCFTLYVISRRVKQGLIWQDGSQQDSVLRWKSRINAFAFLLAFSMMSLSLAMSFRPIAGFACNEGAAFLNSVLRMLRAVFLALDSGDPLPFVMAFALTVVIGSILLWAGATKCKLALSEKTERAVQSVFRERSYSQFPSFVLMALGALLMLCLPAVMLVKVVADMISFGTGEPLDFNRMLLALTFGIAGLLLLSKGGFCYACKDRHIKTSSSK